MSEPIAPSETDTPPVCPTCHEPRDADVPCSNAFHIAPPTDTTASPPSDQSEPTKAVWLIERGQPEHQRPTMWWREYTINRGDVWVQDANRAFHFATREEAERVNEEKSFDVNDRFGRVTEHLFLNPPSSCKGSLGNGLMDALEFSAGAENDRRLAARTALSDLFKRVVEERDSAVAEGEAAAVSLFSDFQWASEELTSVRSEVERLRRFETYVCQVIAMGDQAELTVEALPR